MAVPFRFSGIADAGYGTLLVPDNLGLHAPFPALASAGAAVPDLRLGTFVLAAPLCARPGQPPGRRTA